MQPPDMNERKICVSIAEPNIQTAISSAHKVADNSDVIEIRLDSLESPAITPFVEQVTSDLLFTHRPTWEGGKYSGDEDARIELLLEAVEAGAAYIDIELEAEKSGQQKLISASKQAKTKVIASWHNFKETPDYGVLGEILSRQKESGADIGKIVTMAHDYTDVLRVLHLQILAQKTHFPLIAFCMGTPGVISRLATLDLGGYMTYVAPDEGEATAPGQITLKNLRTILEHLYHAD